MNLLDVLHYGHLLVQNSVAELPEPHWQTPGVCGVWSVKEIIAHLASFEQVLVEVMGMLVADAPTPTLDRLCQNPQQFNDDEVAARQSLSVAALLADYDARFTEVMALAPRIPLARCRQVGILPTYGAEYDLEDFVVYTFYGHKREHCAQIDVYRDQLERAGTIPRHASV